MKPLAKFLALILTSGLAIAISCKKDRDIATYRLPHADAGQDAHIALPQDSILLDGSGSTKTDQEIASYEWTKIYGSPPAEIKSPESIKTMVTGLIEGYYRFELRVKDVLGQISRDTVEISVARNPHSAPRAIAGPDINITKPARSVILNGRGSYDSENDIRSYAWSYVNGPSSYHILFPDSSITEVNSLVTGTYSFELKVTDSTGLFSKDTVDVIVSENYANRNPTIYIDCKPIYISAAVGEVTISAQAYAEDMIGSLYFVNEGHIWRQLSGPNNAFFNTPEDKGNYVTTRVTNMIKGTYLFELGVTFYGGISAYDTIRVDVLDENLKGKEYIFESTWHYESDVDEVMSAVTPRHPELFFPDPSWKTTVFVKLQDSTEWINLSDSSTPSPQFLYIPDGCHQHVSVYSRYPVDMSLEGKKVQIKVKYD